MVEKTFSLLLQMACVLGVGAFLVCSGQDTPKDIGPGHFVYFGNFKAAFVGFTVRFHLFVGFLRV